MSHLISNLIDQICAERIESNAQLQNMAADMLKTISKIQKTWPDKECIADLDTPCDCPKCLIHAATMEAEYDAGKLDPVEDEEECEHDEHEHGYCIDCGEDVIDDLVGRAEDSLNEDR